MYCTIPLAEFVEEEKEPKRSARTLLLEAGNVPAAKAKNLFEKAKSVNEATKRIQKKLKR